MVNTFQFIRSRLCLVYPSRQDARKTCEAGSADCQFAVGLTCQIGIGDSEATVPITLRKTERRGERVSLADQAYYVIRERILKGEIGLGAPLSRRKLAVELGMSLLPVSEALQSLEADGLVESRARVGTRVCFPKPEEIRDRYEVREALESQAARLYAERSTAAERGEMLKMAEHLDTIFEESSRAPAKNREFLYAVHSYHLDFHLRIADGARCRTLREMIEKNHVLIFNWLFDVAASRPPLPANFHRELAEALNSGKVETADRAMRNHVRHGLENIVSILGSRDQDLPFERVK
jgi:DNA-binding GntR family transcriptional regulator